MIDNTMLQRMAAGPTTEAPDVIIEEESEQPTFSRVFTYPISGPGLSIMAIYVLVPFLLTLLARVISLVLPFLGFALGIVVLVIQILILLSTFWYLTVCVRASAEGQIKAPDVFEYSQNDSFFDWLRQFFLILVTVALTIGPAFALRRFLQINYTVFWSILGIGIFFLPMCLLAMAIFDSINALNPVLIIGSIVSTFFSYIAVALLFFAPIFLVRWMYVVCFSNPNDFLFLLVKAISLYLLMMDTYLLGLFFYKNEEKLRWDV